MKKILYFFVYLIYFSTPFESVAIIPGVSVVKLVTVFFLLAALLYYQKIYIPRNNFLILFFIYTIYTILSTIWSIDRITTLQYSLITILPSFIVILFLYPSIQNKAHIEKIFKAYAWGSTIVALIALYMFATGFRFAVSTDNARLTVLGQDQNELSFLLSFGVVSIIYLLRFTRQKRKTQLLLLLMATVLAFVILTTGSRTGFVILVTITLFLTLMFTKKGTIFFLAPLVIGVAVLFFNYLPEYISDRLSQTTEQIENKNLTGRVVVWSMGLNAFEKENSYLLGTGFKTFNPLMIKYYQWDKSPHNTYLSTFIELGIVGLLIYLSMIFYLFRKVYSLYIKESVFYFLLLVPLLLAMLTLGLESRRWLFLIGVLIIKLWHFSK